jgi:regulator of sigma E protease
MIQSLIHLLLALLGLGVLIFIHELGHYWMARRKGMKVEAFSIGFGKPLYVWEHQGVKWQFCMLPFGGYVRIAGMEKQGSIDPHDVPDGYFGKSPWARIQVALAGPIVNMLFAFLIFCLLWAMGGRMKSFSEYTHKIGWTEPSSEIYSAGVRPGDEIEKLNDASFQGFNSFLYAAIFDKQDPTISGTKIDYYTQKTDPFSFTFKEPGLTGVSRAYAIREELQPAQYLIYYSRNADGSNNGLMEGAPMKLSGVQDGDRLVWADGELIFSRSQLITTINESKALLTIKRGDQIFLARVPRLKISDLRFNSASQAELSDWQHAAALNEKMPTLFFIPYNLTAQCEVEAPVSYLNDEAKEQLPIPAARSHLEMTLHAGDKILAVDGISVNNASELLTHLQERKIQMIVRSEGKLPLISWKQADSSYFSDMDWQALQQMIASIGTAQPLSKQGTLRMLNPVSPKPFKDFPFEQKTRAKLNADYKAHKLAIDAIEDPQERAQKLQLLNEQQNRLMVGISFQDRLVRYNPSPIAQFVGVFHEVRKTLFALFSGAMSPKSLAGPIGIVQVMHYTWMVGIKEALYWLGFVSLNLGIVNLLPIPVLDGGHICFSLYEWITRKRISPKAMERMLLPFVILIIGLFIYMTYHDLMRLLGISV